MLYLCKLRKIKKVTIRHKTDGKEKFSNIKTDVASIKAKIIGYPGFARGNTACINCLILRSFLISRISIIRQ